MDLDDLSGSEAGQPDASSGCRETTGRGVYGREEQRGQCGQDHQQGKPQPRPEPLRW